MLKIKVKIADLRPLKFQFSLDLAFTLSSVKTRRKVRITIDIEI